MWCTVEVHTQEGSLGVGASCRTYKDGIEESSWEIQDDLDNFADASGRSKGHTK